MNVFPDPKRFAQWCRPGHRVPLAVEVPRDTETPVSAFLKLAQGGQDGFLFESVEKGERVGRWSFLGVSPTSVHRWNLGEPSDPLAPLRASLREPRPEGVSGLPRFSGGWVGCLGYDSVRLFEPRVPARARREHVFPDALWMRFDTVVACDHLRHTLFVVTHLHCQGEPARVLYEEGMARIGRVLATLERPLEDSGGRRTRLKAPVVRLKPRVSKRAFEAAVRQAREYIHAGDCQQIVLSQRFEAELGIDPFALYRALRRINPSPYLYFLRHQEHALIGSSPETLVRLADGEVTVRPIAGTRRRGRTPEEDASLEAELRQDPKENAEHVMLVDLGRNDVGRVAEVGSVRVETLKHVERYSHVMHLVSEVRGKLRPGLDALDVLRATFPAGTVSGSPKVRAMELIDALEPARRGPYAGCVGFVDFRGELETAITIRTFVQSGKRLSVQAGAGIVFDSNPSAEYEETLNKAGALFRAAEEAQRPPATSAALTRASRASKRRRRRT